MMLNRTRHPRDVPTQTNGPMTAAQIPAAARVLDAHRHRLFAQRLAVLIERIRVGKKEGGSDERD